MNELLDEVDVLEVSGDPSSAEVLRIDYDSRRVEPGSLFFCLPGTRTDGHRFAPEAVRRGAVGLVYEHELPPLPASLVVRARVAPGCARAVMGRAAARLAGHPARALVMAGVTGTNGKTTVSHLLSGIFEHAGMVATAIGTLSGSRTTPEAPDLERLLTETRDRSAAAGRRGAVAMEVSSHALAQSRVEGIRFDVAIFTNLSQDHLDFHRTMEAYFEAKAALFTPERARQGVVNADDTWGRQLLAQPRIPLVAVRPSVVPAAVTFSGSCFRWRGFRVELPLIGRCNVDNALLAAEAAVRVGIDPPAVVDALANARGVPGRMELVAGPPQGLGFWAMVDYAHTPAALETVLAEARRLVAPDARVLVVFGCGGHRDVGKRPQMGAVAAQGADQVFLTSDNPRDEDPNRIIADVAAGIDLGFASSGRLVVEPDRRTAIALAVGQAQPGDLVVVAGKGHETVQEIGSRLVAFDDRTVLREVLRCSR